MNDAKLVASQGVNGYGSNLSDEKGFGNGPVSNTAALGMGAQGRLGLDANGNALPTHKRPSKEETV